MHALRVLPGLVWAIAIGLSAAAAQELPLEKAFETLLPGMGATAIEDRQEPQQKFQNMCFSLSAPGRENERAGACKLMAAKLGPETAKPARLWLLKQLQLLAREESVNAIASLLSDADAELSAAARAALMCIPTPESNARLVAQLSATSDPTVQIALIDALGYRRDPSSVGVLRKQLSDSSGSVAAAAAHALGAIGGGAAADALATLNSSCPELHRAIPDARLCAAQQMLQEGKVAEATAIYQELSSANQPRAVRLAGMTGQLRVAGDQSVSRVLQWLQSDDSDVRAVAAGQIGVIGDPGAMAKLADELPRLLPAIQITLLDVLVSKKDQSALPAAKTAAQSDDPDLQMAGLIALGRLGDTSVVPRLIELATLNSGPISDRAREGLQEANGAGIDEMIVTAVEKSLVSVQRVLIPVLEARGAIAAVPALIQLAENGDSALRTEIIRTLGRLAAPNDIPGLVNLAERTSVGPDRNEIEKAIVSVCSLQDVLAQGEAVLTIYSHSDKSKRLVLLPIVGRLGGPRALQAVEEAIGSADAELVAAGVRALCNWPDASVADALLRIAGSSSDRDHRTWALRAYIRVITIPAALPDAGTLQSLKKAMHMASRDEEKRLILARCASVRSVDTLRWVLRYVDDPSVAAEASRTIIDLARRKELFTPNRDEFIVALHKLVDSGADPAAVERAKEIIQGM